MQTDQHEDENAVRRAVRLAGGPTKVANMCGVSWHTVYKWRVRGWVETARAAVLISEACERNGHDVSVRELAFPPDSNEGPGAPVNGEVRTRTSAANQHEIEDEPAPPASAAHLTQRRLYGPPARKRHFPAYNAPETETVFRNAA